MPGRSESTLFSCGEAVLVDFGLAKEHECHDMECEDPDLDLGLAKDHEMECEDPDLDLVAVAQI